MKNAQKELSSSTIPVVGRLYGRERRVKRNTKNTKNTRIVSVLQKSLWILRLSVAANAFVKSFVAR